MILRFADVADIASHAQHPQTWHTLTQAQNRIYAGKFGADFGEVGERGTRLRYSVR